MSAKKPGKKEVAKAKGPEKKIGSIVPPPISELEAFVRTQPYITPYVLSEKYGLRLSIAKDLLNTLSKKGIINLITGTNRIRIYSPVSPKIAAPAKHGTQPAKKTEEEPVQVEAIVTKEPKKQKSKGKKKK
ncbi:MAG: hypothetical protein QW689_03925 [Nitrososphaerota archaeon]